MQAINTTHNTILCHHGVHARGFWPRFRGLMFRDAMAEGEGLLLQPENAIHTFFMRFPIDVLYLDREGKVLRLAEAMPPNRIGPIVRGGRSVLELPPGVIAQTATVVGDIIRIES